MGVRRLSDLAIVLKTNTTQGGNVRTVWCPYLEKLTVVQLLRRKQYLPDNQVGQKKKKKHKIYYTGIWHSATPCRTHPILGYINKLTLSTTGRERKHRVMSLWKYLNQRYIQKPPFSLRVPP